MRVPLLPHRPAAPPGPRCVVCQDAIDGGAQLRIRGMYIHRRCATYKLRSERLARR